MTDKKTTVIKLDRKSGRWRDGSGKFASLKPKPKNDAKPA